ncbi:hypothetical protein HYV88_06435 [Candidatus Woesearchaeota archaeon]|nr:hypothetical protein [Candidatus Woesearchaeota archaeon]
MKEPEFLFNEEWLKLEKDLKEVLDEIKDPEVERQKYILETFVRGAAYTFVDKNKILLKNRFFPAPMKEISEKEEIPSELGGEEVKQPKYYNEMMNIQTGVDVYPIPVPSTKGNIQPALQFKEFPIYTKKLVQKEDRKRKKPSPLKKPEIVPLIKTTKDLITDNITGKVLATVEISDKYLVNEPGLDSNDIDVLMKIKKKNIKNMEKGWKLIQKYGKKAGIKEGHDTLIKYYLVNDVFGLGRIEPLLHDDKIKSVSCGGEGKKIEVEVDGKILGSNIMYLSKEELFNFVYGLAEKIGVKLNNKNKIVNGILRGFEFTLNIGDDLQTPSFKVVRK